jgi:ABC-2 type transport system permease protein
MAGPLVVENDLKQLTIVARYELLKHFRRRRLFAVLIITFALAALYLIIPPVLGIDYPENAKSFAGNFFGQTTLFIVIAGAFFAGDAISSEFEHRTGYIIFANPTKRVVFVLGKYLGAFLSILAVVILYYLIGLASMLGLYGSVPIEIAPSLGFSLLYVCSVLGLTFFFSSIFRGSIGATLLSFFLLFMILPIISSVVGSFGGNEPWYMVTYAAGIITTVFNPPAQRHVVQVSERMSLHIWSPDFVISVFVMFAYFIIPLILSIFITNKKEMA